MKMVDWGHREKFYLYNWKWWLRSQLCVQGTLKGFDQTINLILDESHERVFSSSQGVEQVVLGLYIVRGDNVWVTHDLSPSDSFQGFVDLGGFLETRFCRLID